MTQWRDRIMEFLPEAKIGKIQQDTVDIEGKDVVLAMVQSLSMKEYDEGTFDTFGLAVFDECRHLGAEVFQNQWEKLHQSICWGCVLRHLNVRMVYLRYLSGIWEI